jgi:hypothetical protein
MPIVCLELLLSIYLSFPLSLLPQSEILCFLAQNVEDSTSFIFSFFFLCVRLVDKKRKMNSKRGRGTARGKNTVSTAPPPSKRGQKRQYVQEFDPITGEELSMETRARRAREILQLKEENFNLKKERIEFLSTLENLNSQLVSFTKDVPEEVRKQNHILKREIDQHVSFLNSFQQVLAEEAKAEQDAKHALYSQGGEAAESFFLGMLNESLHFKRANLPKGMDFPLLDLEFRFAFQHVMFGEEEGKRRRLSLRFDAFVPNPATAESIQLLFSKALVNAEDMQRLYGIQDKPNWNLCPLDKLDDKTQLMYFRRSADHPGESDQYSVFICHQSIQEMAKSTLFPRDLGGAEEKVHGTVQAKLVSMTTTTLLETDPCLSVGSFQKNSAVPVSGMVLKGVVAWNDVECNGVRFIVVYSVPEDYKIINKLSFNDLVMEQQEQHDSSSKHSRKSSSHSLDTEEVCITPKFAQVLFAVTNEFTAMMRESGVDLPNILPHGL